MLVDPVVVMLALIVAIYLAPRIRAGKGVTIASILAHSSTRLNVLLGVTSFFVYQLLTAAQFVAVGKLLAPYFPDLPFPTLVMLPVFSVFLYIYARGFESVTKTDMLQLFLMLSCFVIPALWAFMQISPTLNSGGHVEATSALWTLLTYLALPLFFVPVSNDTNIRIKSAASLGQARYGLFLGGFFLCIAGCDIHCNRCLSKREWLSH